MFKKSFVITVLMFLMLVGLSTAAVGRVMGCDCCRGGMMERMGSMMGMGETEGSGMMQGMEGMAGMGKEEMVQQPLTEGRKQVGEEFVCPIDGMRMKVMEDTPVAEYRGKTYYFCSEEEKQTFLKDPERYVKGK